MASHDLGSVALTLVAEGKGILAADETIPTLTRRFDTLGIQSTEQSRRTYREMLFTTSGAARPEALEGQLPLCACAPGPGAGSMARPRRESDRGPAGLSQPGPRQWGGECREVHRWDTGGADDPPHRRD
jgi:hypothetical protein